MNTPLTVGFAHFHLHPTSGNGGQNIKSRSWSANEEILSTLQFFDKGDFLSLVHKIIHYVLSTEIRERFALIKCRIQFCFPVDNLMLPLENKCICYLVILLPELLFSQPLSSSSHVIYAIFLCMQSTVFL